MITVFNKMIRASAMSAARLIFVLVFASFAAALGKGFVRRDAHRDRT
jgi:hypothetical protein